MNAWQESTRKLVAVVASIADKSKSSVTVTFENEQKKRLGVVFSASVIPATIGILASLLNEVVGDVDHYDRPEMQTLQTSRLRIAMNDQGQVALLIGLEGGGDLPIQIEREQLVTLKVEVEEALAATDLRRRN